MRSDVALLSVTTGLSAITLPIALRLSRIFGAPGLGEASEGFSYALQLVLLRAIVFGLVVYAILKGLERLLSITLSFLLASFMYLLLVPICSLVIDRRLALVISLIPPLFAFTEHRRVFQATLSILAGVYLAIFYPLYLIRFFALLLSIADIIATLKGPMAVVAGFLSLPEKPSEVLAMRVSKEISIGLGDLLIYSALPASVGVNLGALYGLISVLMVPIGVYLSLKRAERRGIVPALPIPVGLISLVIVASLIRKAFLEADSEDR